MKTFDELFQEATLVADRRSKILNELIERVKTEILPRFCDVSAIFDLKTVYFKTSNKVLSDSDKQIGEYEFFYCLAIHVNDYCITDAIYDMLEQKYSIPDHWGKTNMADAKLMRTGILEFTKALNARLEMYIEKYSKEAEKGTALL